MYYMLIVLWIYVFHVCLNDMLRKYVDYKSL